jgi:DNA ligase-1
MEKFEVPILYGMSKNGKVKQWQAKVVMNENRTATIIIESGYVDGKIQEKPKLIKKGKNIGKVNETTPFEQAVSESKSKWNAKRDDNYEPEQMNPNNYIPRLMLPQCAMKPGAGKIVYPAYIQPKLNGVCNLAELCPDSKFNYTLHHHTRGGHLFETLQHLDEWLLRLDAPAPVHGELYKHGWSLQKIGSYTKKIKTDQHLLEYWLYDIGWLEVTFKYRIRWLQFHIGELNKFFPECPIKFVPTKIVNDPIEAKLVHDTFVQQGFEGAMLRNVNGMYMYQFNSDDLVKMKSFQDDEFEIVGGKEGTGTDEGCIIYRCITESGSEFDTRPRGTVENRKQMFIDLPNAIGKMLTVRYAELSEDGIPLQPVGIPEAEAIRDYE